MHSDVETMERIEIIDNLRAGAIDVLVGVNLLREGLDPSNHLCERHTCRL